MHVRLSFQRKNAGPNVALRMHEQRFLAGDEEYRKARCKIIPYVVDGPLAVQLIKPKPVEVTLDGPRHPNRWHQVPKCKARGQAAILECDIDVGLSNKKVRKILNIIRPHIESVTIDVALIVDTLTHQEEEEVSVVSARWARTSAFLNRRAFALRARIRFKSRAPASDSGGSKRSILRARLSSPSFQLKMPVKP